MERGLRDVAKIAVYVAFVLLAGCLLAPPLYWVGQAALDAGWLPDSLRKFGFAKYFNRSVLIAALLGLWPFLRSLSVRSVAELGLAANPRRWSDVGIGFALGAGGLGLVAAAMVFAGESALRSPLPWAKLGPVAATAIAVALVEEALFRGALLGVLRRTLAWPAALGFLSVLFASVHFIRPRPGAQAITQVRWTSGFELLPGSFWQFGEPSLVVGGLLTLTLVGWALGYTVVRTRSLYAAIGLHAGWVFALRAFTSLTQRTGEPGLWLGRDLVTGLAAVCLVAATCLVLVRWLESREGATGLPNGPAPLDRGTIARP